MGASNQLSNDLKTKIVQHYGLGGRIQKAISEISAVSFHCEEHSEEMDDRQFLLRSEVAGQEKYQRGRGEGW